MSEQTVLRCASKDGKKARHQPPVVLQCYSVLVLSALLSVDTVLLVGISTNAINPLVDLNALCLCQFVLFFFK